MKSETFIGVDIGTSRIKAAEVQVNDAGSEIVALKGCPTPAGQDDDLVLAIKEMVPPRTRGVITCIGEGDLILRVVQFPQLKKKELEAAVRHEMERLLPSPEKMIIRHVPLGAAQPGQAQELLLLAVQEDTVYRSYKLFSQAGVLLTAIDLSAFALWRLFGRDTRDSRVIIDCGAQFTTIVIVNKGVIRLIRTISAGGEMPWRTSDNYAALNAIAGEIHRLLVHYSNLEEVCLEKVVITGGNSKPEGLLDYLQDLFEVPVEQGRVVIPELQHKEIDPSFAVAVGLAIREVIR
jgi:type IV pilus assembly protein PilM